MEVMDSLLMVRGIRTLLRGAVAASSAIFFFSLANMVILSTSLSLSLSTQDVRLHVVWRSLGFMAPQAHKAAVFRRWTPHFLPAASTNGKRQK